MPWSEYMQSDYVTVEEHARVVSQRDALLKAHHAIVSALQVIANDVGARIEDVKALASEHYGTDLNAYWQGARDELQKWQPRLQEALASLSSEEQRQVQEEKVDTREAEKGTT